MSDFIRDLDEAKKFADDVEDYITKMKKNCTDLSNNIDVLDACIKDSLGVEAVSVFTKLVEDIKKDLPAAEEMVLRLRKSFTPMEAARTIRVRR